MQLEGLGQLKNPTISSGIKPMTFRLVAQCLNELRYTKYPSNWMQSCKNGPLDFLTEEVMGKQFLLDFNSCTFSNV
jgi:hypothetical protein